VEYALHTANTEQYYTISWACHVLHNMFSVKDLLLYVYLLFIGW